MAALFRLLFAALFAGLFITGVFYFIASVLGGLAFNPESKAWKELLAKLRGRLSRPTMPRPAERDGDTLAQLSLKPKILKKAGWRDPVFEGVFSTIYQEPVMVFAGQKSGKTAAVVAQTSDKEFIFRQKGKETEIWQDGQPYAVFVNGTLISAGKQSRLLAQLEADSDQKQWPVLIGQSEAATLTNEARAVSPIPRALTLLRKLQPEEEQALLVLVVAKTI